MQFLQFSMLAWAAASIIPFLLSRYRRLPKQRLDWSATRFLHASAQRSEKRFNLQQWLVLLLRAAALLLVGLAVAEPIRATSDATSERQRGQKFLCVIIDRSASTGALTTLESDVTLLQTAKEVLDTELRKADADDLLAVYLADQTNNLVYWGDAIDAMNKTDSMSDWRSNGMKIATESIVPAVQSAISEASRELSTISICDVIIVSDFSKAEWSSPTLKVLVDQIASMPKTTCRLISSRQSVEAESVENVSIASVRLDGFNYWKDRTNLLTEIRNSGQTMLIDRIIQLQVDGQVRDTRTLSLKPGETKQVNWSLERSRAFDQSVEVSFLGEDQLEIDNHRYLVIPRMLDDEVSVVADFEDDSIPVTTALRSLGLKPQDSQMNELALLKRPRLIHVIDPETVSLVGDSLYSLAVNGANLVIWLGNRTVPDVWQSSYDLSTHKSVFPGRSLKRQKWDGDELAEVVIASEVSEFVSQTSDSIAIPMSRYWGVEDVTGDWLSILSLSDGTGFAFQRRIGNGSLTWVTTPPTLSTSDEDNAWNYIANWPTFVPLVDSINMAAINQPQRNYECGQTINWNNSFDINESVDSGVSMQSAAPRLLVLKDEFAVQFDRPGIYENVTQQGSSSGSKMQKIGVNADSDDFQLEYLGNESIVQSQPPVGPGQVLDQSVQSNRLSDASGLFKYLLIVAIVLLCLEMIASTWLTFESPRSRLNRLSGRFPQ